MGGVVDDSFPFDFGSLEVDEETEVSAGGFEVVEALGGVGWGLWFRRISVR